MNEAQWLRPAIPRDRDRSILARGARGAFDACVQGFRLVGQCRQLAIDRRADYPSCSVRLQP